MCTFIPTNVFIYYSFVFCCRAFELSSSEEDEIFNIIGGVSIPHPHRKRQKKLSQSSNNAEGSPRVSVDTPQLSERPQHLSFREGEGEEDKNEQDGRTEQAVSPGGTISPAVKNLLYALRSKSTPSGYYGSLPRKSKQKRGHMRNWSGGSIKSFDFAVAEMQGGVIVSSPQKRLHSKSPLRRSCSSLVKPGPSPLTRQLFFEEHRDQPQQPDGGECYSRIPTVDSKQTASSSPESEDDTQEGCDADESSDEESGPSGRTRPSTRHSSSSHESRTTSLSEVQFLKTFYDKKNLPPISQQLQLYQTNNDSGFQVS